MKVRAKVASSAVLLLLGAVAFFWLRRGESQDGGRRAAVAVDSAASAHGGPIGSEPAVTVASVPFSELAGDATSPPQSSADPPASLDVIFVWADGKLAEGVGARLAPDPPAAGAWATSRWAESDGLGHAVFAGLEPGRWRLASSRGTQESLTLSPGKRANLTVILPEAPDLTVSVTDPEGEALAGAEILVSEQLASWLEHRIGETGADGTCVVRALKAGYVSARHPRFARSLRYPADRGPQIRIRMSGRGSSVEGEVVDAAGEPLAGAAVVLGGWEGSSVALDAEGRYSLLPTTDRTTTDGDGRFRLDGVPENPALPLSVHRPGFGTWAQSIVVAARAPTRVRVVLEPAVTIEGVVRDAKGQPVSGAAVAIDRGSMANTSTMSNPDGSYVLYGVAAGRLEVQATKSGSGVARAVLTAVAGEKLRWDAVLLPVPVIRGRVVDETGRGVQVRVMLQILDAKNPRKYFRSVATDEQGRFSFDDCPDGPLRLDIHRDDSMTWLFAPATVQRGGPDLLYTIDSALLRSGFVEGRVLLSDGGPLPSTTVYAKLVGRIGASGRTADPATGRFRLGPMPPGLYEIQVFADGFPDLWSEPQPVAVDETRDAGDLSLRRGGKLALSLAIDDPLVLDAIKIEVIPESWPQHPIRVHRIGSAAIVPPLPVGTHVVDVSGPHVAPLRREFTIRQGAETKLAVTLETVR